MRNIFLEKLHTKCNGETSPKPFSKKSILRIFSDRQPEILYSLFLLYYFIVFIFIVYDSMNSEMDL